MRAEDQEINKAKDKLLSQKKKLSTLQTKLNTHAKKVRSYHKSIEEAKVLQPVFYGFDQYLLERVQGGGGPVQRAAKKAQLW